MSADVQVAVVMIVVSVLALVLDRVVTARENRRTAAEDALDVHNAQALDVAARTPVIPAQRVGGEVR